MALDSCGGLRIGGSTGRARRVGAAGLALPATGKAPDSFGGVPLGRGNAPDSGAGGLGKVPDSGAGFGWGGRGKVPDSRGGAPFGRGNAPDSGAGG